MSLPFLFDQLLLAIRDGRMTQAEPLLQMLRDQAKVTAVPGTLVECAKCHDTGAPEYRLRRVMGRYILLCYRGGDGCWERSPLPLCSYKDEQGVPCSHSAELRVSYGEDETTLEDVCAVHVIAALTPSHGKMTVYPLEV